MDRSAGTSQSTTIWSIKQGKPHTLLYANSTKAIHAQESKKAAREKAKAVVTELRAMKLKEAAKKIEDGVEETLTYADFPSEQMTRIRTNNVIERLNREIRLRGGLWAVSRMAKFGAC